MNLWRLNMSYKWANMFFKCVYIDCIVHNYIFFKSYFFHYVLTCSVKFFIWSIASRLLSSSVFVRCPHWCVHFEILSNAMDFYQWKLKFTWSWKQIICKRITEHTCWSVGVKLTCHIKFCMCINSTPK